MSSTNKTTYYELPQFVDNDIFNPLVDDNDAYSKIDTALHNIADAEADDASEIVGIKSRLDGAEGDIDALEAQNGDSVLTTTAQTLSSAINELAGDVNALDGRLDIVEDDMNNASTGLKVKVATAENDIDALEAQSGSEVLTTTAQTLSGAVNELNGKVVPLHNSKYFVTPEQFGAVGDGTTDDTNAIQSAIDTGLEVHLMPKTYLVRCAGTAGSYALELKDGSIILGDGGATLKMADDIQIGRILCHGRTEAIEKIIIDNVNFIGTCSEETDDETGLCAIEAITSTGIIRNCSMSGFNKNIELTECSFFKVEHNHIKDATETASSTNGYGVLLEAGDNIHISDNLMENIERHCVYVNETSYATVENNNLYGQTNNLTRYSHLEGNIKVDGADHVIIKNNNIHGNYYGIMFLKGFTKDYGVKNCLISGNLIDGIVSNPGFSHGGIGVYEGEAITLEDVTIIDNVIKNVGGTNGIFFFQMGITNLSIINNTVDGFTTGVRLKSTGKGIVLTNNKMIDCTTAYDFAYGAYQYFKGGKNYYKDCTTAVNGDGTALRYAYIEGIENLDLENNAIISGTDLTINPFENTRFVSTNAVINHILPAMQNTVILIKSSAASGIVMLVADVDSNIKLADDFRGDNGEWIVLKRVDLDWVEQYRYKIS